VSQRQSVANQHNVKRLAVGPVQSSQDHQDLQSSVPAAGQNHQSPPADRCVDQMYAASLARCLQRAGT